MARSQLRYDSNPKHMYALVYPAMGSSGVVVANLCAGSLCIATSAGRAHPMVVTAHYLKLVAGVLFFSSL